MAASNLTLVLPPLSFSAPENVQFISLLEQNAKSLAALRCVLSRGERQSFVSQELMLIELFGLPYRSTDELPLAAIMAMGSGFDAATGYWLHAEPVHLHPDLDHVLLFDRSEFELAKHELGQLIEELQELFEESGLSIHFGKQNNLFIRSNDEPKVLFSPLQEVLGKNILQHLPEGKDSAQWRLLQNELQMQMTQSTVNHRREESGVMTVNGLWFWGGGYLARAKFQRCYDHVVARSLFVAGLARMTDAVIENKIEHFKDINLSKKTLVAIESAEKTPETSLAMLLGFEQQWLSPALAALKKGEITNLTLLVGKTKTTITKKQLKRFWKRNIRTVTMASLLS